MLDVTLDDIFLNQSLGRKEQGSK